MSRTTQQFSITLPTELALAAQRKVEAGEYASISEVVRDGMRALMARDRAMERLFDREAAEAYDAWSAEPGNTRSVSEAFAALRRRIEKSEPEGR